MKIDNLKLLPKIALLLTFSAFSVFSCEEKEDDVSHQQSRRSILNLTTLRDSLIEVISENENQSEEVLSLRSRITILEKEAKDEKNKLKKYETDTIRFIKTVNSLLQKNMRAEQTSKDILHSLIDNYDPLVMYFLHQRFCESEQHGEDALQEVTRNNAGKFYLLASNENMQQPAVIDGNRLAKFSLIQGPPTIAGDGTVNVSYKTCHSPQTGTDSTSPAKSKERSYAISEKYLRDLENKIKSIYLSKSSTQDDVRDIPYDPEHPKTPTKPKRHESSLVKVKEESEKISVGNGLIGPRILPGSDWIFDDVEDEGNCFYDAVILQMRTVNHPFLREVPEGTNPRDSLRLRVQGDNFRDEEWAEEQLILDGFVRAFDVILSIVDTRIPQVGFTYYYSEGGDIITVIPGEDIPVPQDKPIIRIAITGNHFLSVRNHP